LYDEEDYVVDTYSWDEEKNTILGAFGTSIQHPEEHFVQYFGGTPVLVIEKGSPRRSPRIKPTETDNEEGKGLSSLGSPQPIDSTLEGTPSLATGNIIHDPSNVQKSNIQTHPRKAIPCQLPFKKHRHSSIYYRSAFTTYPRHKRPENISSNPDVVDLLLKVFSSRARVSTQKVWNPIIESWNQPKKSSFLSLPLLTQESNMGDDDLTLQSTFNVNINEEDYLASLCADPYLFVASMPPDDQLKKHYTKLLEGITLLKQIISM
jgi:hypothetical protein